MLGAFTKIQMNSTDQQQVDRCALQDPWVRAHYHGACVHRGVFVRFGSI